MLQLVKTRVNSCVVSQISGKEKGAHRRYDDQLKSCPLQKSNICSGKRVGDQSGVELYHAVEMRLKGPEELRRFNQCVKRSRFGNPNSWPFSFFSSFSSCTDRRRTFSEAWEDDRDNTQHGQQTSFTHTVFNAISSSAELLTYVAIYGDQPSLRLQKADLHLFYCISLCAGQTNTSTSTVRLALVQLRWQMFEISLKSMLEDYKSKTGPFSVAPTN